VNCTEFHQDVCECIDKRLSAQRTGDLLEHTKRCPHCKYEYDSLQAVKHVVHTKLQYKSVPADLYYSIVKATSGGADHVWFKKLFGFTFNPVIAFVIVLFFAVGIYSLFIPSSSMPDDANIISQSLKNYQAVIGGSIKPAMVDKEENVRNYLEKGVSFSVNVPKMPGCSWCGAVLSNFKGTKLAHVVYGLGGEKVIYIYQANLTDAMEGKTIGLPSDVKDELIRTNWYTKEYPDSTIIILWKYQNTLCAAVSKMNKDELMALLTEKDWK